MSGARSPYLMRRSGQLYIRLRVPNDLIERVGCCEVHRSLGPMRFHDARPLAAQIGARLKECFVMIRTESGLSKSQIRKLVRDCYVRLSDEADRGFQPQSSSPWEEAHEPDGMALERLRYLGSSSL